MTHARLRAEQGDVRGARALLRRVLERSPAHLPALELLERLEGRADAPRDSGPAEQSAGPVSATAADLARSFRMRLGDRPPGRNARTVARLESWLARITRTPSSRPA